MIKPKLNEQQDHEIIELYKTGKYSCKTIGYKYGVCSDTVYNILKRYNIDCFLRSKRLTKQQIQELIKLYKTGLYSTTTLAKKFNIKYGRSVWKILNKNGVETVITKDDRRWKEKHDENLINEIINLYKTGKYNFDELSKKFNIPTGTIPSLLKRRECRFRTLSEAQRRYKVKEDFFDVIDTQEKAYFLGFLYADGCNNVRNNTVTIGLQERDKEILEKLRDLISPDRPLYYFDRSRDRKRKGFENSQNVYALTICNKHISNRLAELGCGQAKTHTLTFPEWLDKNLIRHFIRGYFDGDGGICIPILKSPNLNIISTLSFCTSLKEIVWNVLSINMGIHTPQNCKNNNIRCLESGGRQKVTTFLDWIYKDSTIHLQRKYEKYLLIKKKYEEMKILKPWYYNRRRNNLVI